MAQPCEASLRLTSARPATENHDSRPMVLNPKPKYNDEPLTQFLLQLVDTRFQAVQLEQRRLLTKVRQDLSLQQAELFSVRLEFDLALAKLTAPPNDALSPRQLDAGSLWEDLRDIRRELHGLKATQSQHSAELAVLTTSFEQSSLPLESNKGPQSKVQTPVSSDLSQSLVEMSQMIQMINTELNTELSRRTQSQSQSFVKNGQGIVAETLIDFPRATDESAETCTTLEGITEDPFSARVALTELQREVGRLSSEVEDVRNERKLLFKAAKASAIQELKSCPLAPFKTVMWDENEDKKEMDTTLDFQETFHAEMEKPRNEFHIQIDARTTASETEIPEMSHQKSEKTPHAHCRSMIENELFQKILSKIRVEVEEVLNEICAVSTSEIELREALRQEVHQALRSHLNKTIEGECFEDVHSKVRGEIKGLMNELADARATSSATAALSDFELVALLATQTQSRIAKAEKEIQALRCQRKLKKHAVCRHGTMQTTRSGGGSGGGDCYSPRQLSTGSAGGSTCCTDNHSTGWESFDSRVSFTDATHTADICTKDKNWINQGGLQQSSPHGSPQFTRSAPSIVPMLPLHLVPQTPWRGDSSPMLPERMLSSSHIPMSACSSGSIPEHNIIDSTCCLTPPSHLETQTGDRDASQPSAQSVAGSVPCVTPIRANEHRKAGTLSGKFVWPQPHDIIRTRVCDALAPSVRPRTGGGPWAQKGKPKNASELAFDRMNSTVRPNNLSMERSPTITSRFQSSPTAILQDGSCSPTGGGWLFVAPHPASLQTMSPPVGGFPRTSPRSVSLWGRSKPRTPRC